MRLIDAIQVSQKSIIAVVGSGGKTSTIQKLAQQYKSKIIVSTSTHVGVDQIGFVDHHVLIKSADKFDETILESYTGIIAITGEMVQEKRYCNPGNEYLQQLISWCKRKGIPLLIEADGARGLPLKAPDVHEPAIPNGINQVIVIMGLKGIGKPLSETHVYNHVLFSNLSNLKLLHNIDSETIIKVIGNPLGGLKNIPDGVRKTLLINQADNNILLNIGINIGQSQVRNFHEVLICKLRNQHANEVKRRIVYVSAILLAAGQSSRMGTQKQLLDWKGKSLIRHVAEQVLQANIQELIVVIGSQLTDMKKVLSGLNIKIIENQDWRSGQASSIRTGLAATYSNTGACVISVCDQPFLNKETINNLIVRHQKLRPPIVLPIIDNIQRNPVLFDQCTFTDLIHLSGDKGGKAIFNEYLIDSVKSHAKNEFFDLDTIEDYQMAIRRHEPKKNTAAIVLAAGLSSRMGRMKLLLPWKDKVLIQDVVFNLLRAGLKKIIVVVGNQKVKIKQALENYSVIFVENTNYENGSMLDSVKAGLVILKTNEDALLVLGDQPGIEEETIKQIIKQARLYAGYIIIPSYKFRRGHPWYIPAEFIKEILKLGRECTLKEILDRKEEFIKYVVTEDKYIVEDIDTPEEYEKRVHDFL